MQADLNTENFNFLSFVVFELWALEVKGYGVKKKYPKTQLCFTTLQ